MSKKGEQAFKDLKEVISVFRGDEERVARIYVSTLTSKKQKVNDAALLVFKEAKKKRSTYTTLNQNIDLTSVPISLDRLLENVLAQTRESLILRANTEMKGHYSDLFKIKFRLAKMLDQTLIFNGRGIRNESDRILDEIIATAKTYELFDILVKALSLKRNMHSAKKYRGSPEYKKIISKLNYYLKCLALYREASNIYYSVNDALFVGLGKGVQNSDVKRDIDKVYQISKEINSKNILCYYYLLQIKIHKDGVVNNELIRYFDELIKTLYESPATYSKERIAIMHKEKAILEMTCLRFRTSLINLTEAIDLHGENNGINYSYALLYKVEVLILIGKRDVAHEVVKLLHKKKFVIQYFVAYSELLYKEGIVCFLKEEFQQSFLLLSEKQTLEKDKGGWNIWIRIMRILCNIELNKLENIDYEIENFRKYLERTGKEHEVRERDQLILKVLIELNRQSFDYQKTVEKRKEELDKLSSTDRAYAWKPDSAELVLFHEWFKSKLSGKAYRPNFNVYRQAWYPEIDYTGEDVNV